MSTIALPAPSTATAASGYSISRILDIARHYGRCYYELSKTRLSLLVVSTAAAGFVMGSGPSIDWSGLAATSTGTMLAACSANTFNQLLEIRNDSLMKRTLRRPLPSGRISVPHAMIWAVGSGAAGVAILWSQTNELTAALGAGNIALYALVYTPLKQLHWANTWAGAVVGAIPPLMGWAAASGQLDPPSLVLASSLYFWQLPHFLALAWLCKKDYAAGGYRMLSLAADVTGRRTAAAALRNCIYLAPLGFIAVQLGLTSLPFAFENLALAGVMAASAFSFYSSPSTTSARSLFRLSLLHLPLLMGAMMAHRVPNTNTESLEQLSTSGAIIEDISADNETSMVQKHATHASMAVARPVEFADEELRTRRHAMPPVASFSAAPFPFLPPPPLVYRGY